MNLISSEINDLKGAQLALESKDHVTIRRQTSLTKNSSKSEGKIKNPASLDDAFSGNLSLQPSLSV